MGAIDYKIDTDVRWAKLMTMFEVMPLDERKQMLYNATNYRSGSDSCNSVYMGGMETAGLCRVLGIQYGEGGMLLAIENASEDTLSKAIEYSMHTIEYMLHNPRGKCPACGQIVKADG